MWQTIPNRYHEYPDKKDGSPHDYTSRRRITGHVYNQIFGHQVLFVLELPHREGERPKLLDLSEDGDLVVTIDDRNAEIFFGKDEWSILKNRLNVPEDSNGREKVQVIRCKEVSHFDLGYK
jgi:hypothetical protein